MAKSGHKGISRIDCPERKTVGWYVRVRLGNVTKSKFISDSKYGGREAALMSGVVGVRRAVKKYTGKDGTVYENEVYEVSWNAGREKKGRTSVSIKKYGEAAAFRRACAIRRQKEQLMYGKPVTAKLADIIGKVC